ncbi:hypothetical protein LCGC14_0794670, partial [marine sediment metagenome]
MEIKICGLTNLDDARSALDNGADYLGFVLYGKSPRGVSFTRLRHIQERLPDNKRSVGVFVNESKKKVLKIATECGLHAVQLHGKELPDEFNSLPLPVWRAVHFQHGKPIPNPGKWQAERYVIDTASEGKYGGTGMVVDWEKAAKFSQKWPAMLAGGLSVNNIETAIRRVNPIGVDVASGVELNPGKRDHTK